MNVIEKQKLSKEAEMQIKALKQVACWKRIAYLISVIGVALAYAGMAGIKQDVFLTILGIALILISTICAVILNLGLKNGRRNVEKILNLLDKGTV